MSTRFISRCVLVMVVCLSVGGRSASADTFVLHDAQMSVPEGWGMKTAQDGVSTLLPRDKGHFIELYRFKTMPAADTKAIAALFAARKNTTDVVITKAGSASGAVSAMGSLKIKGTPVSIGLLAIKVKDHVVVLVSYIETSHRDEVKGIHEAIFKSLKAAESPKRGAARE